MPRSPPGGYAPERFSPDDKHLALVSNIGTPSLYDYRVYMTHVVDYNPAPSAKPLIPGCQVSWRSDSQALAVMQPAQPCDANATGTILQVDLSDPRNPTILATNAAHPAWQPVPPGN